MFPNFELYTNGSDVASFFIWIFRDDVGCEYLFCISFINEKLFNGKLKLDIDKCVGDCDYKRVESTSQCDNFSSSALARKLIFIPPNNSTYYIFTYFSSVLMRLFTKNEKVFFLDIRRCNTELSFIWTFKQ